MKLWHDDVRPPPSVDWAWAQTNEEAKLLFYNANAIAQAGGDAVIECSLDHDLGARSRAGIYAKGAAEETGTQLVEWMIESNIVPRRVVIHSWNIPGAKRMWQAFTDAGYRAELAPFVATS